MDFDLHHILEYKQDSLIYERPYMIIPNPYAKCCDSWQ